MIRLLTNIASVVAIIFYTPDELRNKCRNYGIRDEDCKGSTYIHNLEYDNFLKSFNLPIQKDPECDKKRCFVSVFKDPPKVLVNSTGNMECGSGQVCSPEKYQGYRKGSQSQPQQAGVPQADLVRMFRSILQQSPYLSPPYPSQQSNKDLTAVTGSQHLHPENSREPLENEIVTVVRPVYSTVTVDRPITLYREITTTVRREIPLTNYKVTTVTEEVPTTKTVENTVSTTEMATKTISVTESIPITIVSKYLTTSISTECTTTTMKTTIFSSFVSVSTKEKTIMAPGGEKTSHQTIASIPSSVIQDVGVVSAVSPKENPTDTKAVAPKLAKEELSTQIPVEKGENDIHKNQHKVYDVDIPGLLRPILEKMTRSKEDKDTERRSKSISDVVQKTIYITRTLPPEINTMTINRIKTLIKKKTITEKALKRKGPHTVYNTVYSYKKKKLNPRKMSCKPKWGEYSEEDEAVSTVFIYKQGNKQKKPC